MWCKVLRRWMKYGLSAIDRELLLKCAYQVMNARVWVTQCWFCNTGKSLWIGFLSYLHLTNIFPPFLSLPTHLPWSPQICSIIVFGCIADKLDVSINGHGVCLYNRSNACSFGVTIGVLGFLMCLAFLVKDVLYVVIDFSNNLTVSLSTYRYITQCVWIKCT